MNTPVEIITGPQIKELFGWSPTTYFRRKKDPTFPLVNHIDGNVDIFDKQKINEWANRNPHKVQTQQLTPTMRKEIRALIVEEILVAKIA